mgnify:CR=1 FL=1
MQSTYDLTKNIKEIIRFGRLLWIRYTQPLQPSRIDETLAWILRKLASFQPPVKASSHRVEQELFTFLDRKMLSQVRSLVEEHLFALSVPTLGKQPQLSHHDMPDRAKYLLLAAYLCQSNRPDRDKHLFTIQKNGRRRKSAVEGNSASQDTAFGTNANNGQPKSLRLRAFPLERMLSVFVSLVALHRMDPEKDAIEEDAEILLSLGDDSLQRNIELLEREGVLHSQPSSGSTDPVRLSGRRYWCELTEDEALRVAESMQFPLSQYML